MIQYVYNTKEIIFRRSILPIEFLYISPTMLTYRKVYTWRHMKSCGHFCSDPNGEECCLCDNQNKVEKFTCIICTERYI